PVPRAGRDARGRADGRARARLRGSRTMASYANTRPEVRVDAARTLPARYYTNAAWFERELEAIHYDMWLHAGRLEELDAPGCYFGGAFGNASVIVLRDENGGLRAFHNSCRHRGTRLCAEPAGKLAGRLQCPYHAWTYGLDGSLRSAPHMDKVVGFREADYPLAPVAATSWDGHVFINLSPEPAPLAEQLAGLDLKFRPWRMEELRRVERRVYRLRGNGTLVLQTTRGCGTCRPAPPLLTRRSHYRSGDNEPPQPTSLGGRMDLRPGVETLSHDGSRAGRACLPGLGEADRRHVYYYCVLPGLLLNLHPDYMLTFQIWPKAVDATEVVCEWHFHPDEI